MPRLATRGFDGGLKYYALGRLYARNTDAPKQMAELALALYWKMG